MPRTLAIPALLRSLSASISCVLLIWAASLFQAHVALAESPCARIVSLAPSVTETIYSAGLGQAVVGVSRFDRYPAEVTLKPIVGGLFDPNMEAIARLKPTVVMLLREHGALKHDLQALAISTLELNHDSIHGIIDSLKRIHQYCEAPLALQRAEHLTKTLEEWQVRSAALPKPRILVVIGSLSEGGQAQSLYISGRDGYYFDVVQAAGGTPAYASSTAALPALSIESLMSINPDVILLIQPTSTPSLSKAEALAELKRLFPAVRAVKNAALYTSNADYLYIPGPRFPEAIADVHAMLHPASTHE